MTAQPPTQEAFDKLLGWLNPDRDKAGERYNQIQLRLIRIFACQGCCEPEDLADKALDVVIRRIDWLVANYQGDPALYFYGVARKIFLEYQRKPIIDPPPPPEPEPDEITRAWECLETCLDQLRADDRTLVLRYHQEQKGAKIRLRKRIADELGLSRNALRIKMCHLRSQLRQCVFLCLQGHPN